MMQGASIVQKSDNGPVATPQAAANFFLQRAVEEKKPLSPMKLIKLVYIAHGWILATLDRPLFMESVEAWQHGPVVPSLYHEFKHFGFKAIDCSALEFDINSGEFYVPQIDCREERALTVLEKVWDVYKELPATELRQLTHAEGTPWRKVYNPRERHIQIPNEEIKQHYIELLTRITGLNERRN